MRVLVVDQDSSSNEAIARSLRELFTVDAVTNKGDCLDLLRSNTFEVIVAAERLEDGSGLELLGQIAKRWPSVLRIFAADRHRLQLLKGRLEPFELFQTLTYPIDPDRLIATLNLAAAAQGANADTSSIQHVVLSGDLAREIEQTEGSADVESFPAPQPIPRAAPVPVEHSRAVSRGAARDTPSHRARSSPGQTPKRNGAGGSPITRAGTSSPPARATASSPSLSPDGGRPSRHRSQVSNRPPVRFPPLEQSPLAETLLDSPAKRSSQANSFAEAAGTAHAARSSFESPPEDFDGGRLTFMIAGGAVVLLAAVVLGSKLLGSKSQAPRAPAPPLIQAPEYPPEVTELIAQIESALKSDDFKVARADVDKLRQAAPSHPRLAFFEGLLAQRSDASNGSANSLAAHGTAKRNAQSSRLSGSSAPAENKTNAAAAPMPKESVGTTVREASATAFNEPAAATRSELATTPDGPGAATRNGLAAAPKEAAFPPETLPGMSRPAAASAPPSVVPTPEVGTVHTASDASPVAATPTVPKNGSPASVQPAAASTLLTRQASSGEPPPVVREAKLIHRVDPEYPGTAKHDGLQGSVDLEVTVSARGVVEHVSVIRANPPDMFEKSAVAAVRKWKYDPRFVDGLPSEAHLKVHLDFSPGR